MFRGGRRDLPRLIAGAAALAATGTLARRGVSETEAQVFRWANDLPDEAFRAMWVPMQYGTFATVPVLAGLALLRRRPRRAAAVGLAGTAAWILAKVIKPAVGRGRPVSGLAGVHLRGKEQGDLGFPSGHAAVSAALTVVAWPYVANRFRPTVGALTAVVPFARMYVGAHLPLDVIGGSALGLAVGSAVSLALRARLRLLPGGSRQA